MATYDKFQYSLFITRDEETGALSTSLQGESDANFYTSGEILMALMKSAENFKNIRDTIGKLEIKIDGEVK